MKITNEMLAYAQGYWDGRHEGVENNPYDPADPLRVYYTAAYESGVGDYCRFDCDDQGEIYVEKREYNPDLYRG